MNTVFITDNWTASGGNMLSMMSLIVVFVCAQDGVDASITFMTNIHSHYDGFTPYENTQVRVFNQWPTCS